MLFLLPHERKGLRVSTLCRASTSGLAGNHCGSEQQRGALLIERGSRSSLRLPRRSPFFHFFLQFTAQVNDILLKLENTTDTLAEVCFFRDAFFFDDHLTAAL